MPTITNLRSKTSIVLNNFIKNIANIKLTDNFQRNNLLLQTKELFDTLDNLGIEEFSKIFKEFNFNSIDIKEHEKHQEVLNCLVALIIEKYPHSELFRYFFPENLSKKEDKPEYSSNSSRISYWFQLIHYWLRQLCNKPKYALSAENNSIAESIEYIKASFSKQAYNVNNTNNDFKMHLAILVEEIENPAIYPNLDTINRENFTHDQAYRQALLDKERDLKTLDRNLTQKDRKLRHSEQKCLDTQQEFGKILHDLELKEEKFQKEKDLLIEERKYFEIQSSEKQQLLEAKQHQLFLSEQSLQERKELLVTDRKEIEEQRKKYDLEIKELNAQILGLKASKNEKKHYINHLENDNYNYQKILSELSKTTNAPNEFHNILEKHKSELTLEDSQNNNELSTSEEHENNTQAKPMSDLTDKFTEEFEKFSEKKRQKQFSSQVSINSCLTNASWDTVWDESGNETDGNQPKNVSFLLTPTQEAELLKTIQNNLSGLQSISVDQIIRIVKTSLQTVITDTVQQSTSKNNRWNSNSLFKCPQNHENPQTVTSTLNVNNS